MYTFFVVVAVFCFGFTFFNDVLKFPCYHLFTLQVLLSIHKRLCHASSSKQKRVRRLHCVMLATMFLLATSATQTKRTPVKLIIDTDIGGGGCNDVDDVVAVSIAHALADNGEAELLAVVQNSAPVRCAGAISVLNHYYGRDDVPVGAYKSSFVQCCDVNRVHKRLRL